MRFREQFAKITDNVIPDLRDNFPRLSKIRSWEITNKEADSTSIDQIREKFLSRSRYQELKAAAESALESGQLYEHTWIVGSREKGTNHPHTFLGEKSEYGANLFFIDPEHNVGKQNVFRPKISNLVSIDLGDNYHNSRFAVIRFNIEGLTPDQLKLQQQFVAAKELLDKDGPTMLKGSQENILFQAIVENGKVVLRARYTNEKKAQNFLHGGEGSRALRGKIKANAIIVDRLISFLQAGKFEPTKRFK